MMGGESDCFAMKPHVNRATHTLYFKHSGRSAIQRVQSRQVTFLAV